MTQVSTAHDIRQEIAWQLTIGNKRDMKHLEVFSIARRLLPVD